MVEPVNQDDLESILDVKVPIRQQYISILPFALKTRHGIALVFAFFGYSA